MNVCPSFTISLVNHLWQRTGAVESVNEVEGRRPLKAGQSHHALGDELLRGATCMAVANRGWEASWTSVGCDLSAISTRLT